MATAFGYGIDLSGLNTAIDNADKKLKILATTGTKTAKAIDDAFKQASVGGIKQLSDSLEAINNALRGKGAESALKNIGTQAVDSANKITQLVESIRGGGDRFTDLMARINKTGAYKQKNGTLESLDLQIEEQFKKLKELKDFLNFFAKGEGLKAVNANVHPKEEIERKEKEALAIQRKIEALQREREQEEANARLIKQLRSWEKQENNDNIWAQMSKERREALQEESRIAKESSEQYKEEYDERYRHYEKIFDKIIAKEDALAEKTRLKEESDAEKQGLQDWLAKKRAEEKEHKRVEDEKFEATKRTIDKQNREYEKQRRLQEEKRRQQEEYRGTTKGALEYSAQAKSINELQRAIKYLDIARRNEDLSTKQGEKNYQQLTNELRRQSKTYEELTQSVNRSHRGLMDISGQLQRSLALVFSVSQIRGYINEVIKVRGEFELQQRALQAILQDQDAANELWDKTVDLAVKSPFRVKELVTYTKQLAAYRIETDKLYETNKMLADISAGLGVDMNRLILAYGQVRSASYLRGTELRQFTEAGIPLLEELSKYFTELEGRAVSVGDVFERISKRMVGFEDVAEIFKKLTTEGGTFYQMQEIQAETLQGQISNLRDSIDLMLNEIGSSSESVIKKNIGRVRTLVENWERVADVLKFVVAGFGVFKLNSLLANKALQKFAISQGFVVAGSSKLQRGLGLTSAGFARLFGIIKAGLATSGWLLAITAILDIIMKTVSWMREYNESIAEVNQKYFEQTAKINRLTDAYDKLLAAERAEGADSEAIFQQKKENLEELLAIAENDGIKLPIELDKISQDNIDEIVSQIRNEIIYAADWGKEFGIVLAKGLGGAQGRFLGVNWFGDNLETDLEQLDNAMGKLGGATKQQIGYALTELEARWEELPNVVRAYYEEIKAGRKEGESENAWLERQVELIAKAEEGFVFYGKAGLQNAKAIRDAENTRLSIVRKREEVERHLAQVAQQQLDKYGVENFSDLTPETQQLVKMEIDKAFSELQISEELKRWASAFEANKFKINYVLAPESDSNIPKELAAWQKNYNAYIANFSEETRKVVRNITDASTERKTLATELKEIVELNEAIVTAVNTGSKAYSKEEYNLAKKIAEEAKKAQIWIEGQKIDKGKDERLEKLKNQINLIKEMNREYEKLNKTFSKTESLEKVRNAYADTAKELGLDLSKMDFTDAGTIKSLEDLLGDPKYAANKYALELKKALDNFKVELGIETKQGEDETLKNQIQELFDRYDLSLELKKLNIPPDLAKALFGIESINLSDIREKVQGELDSAKAAGGQEDRVKQLEKDLEKINDMEDKAQIERLKTYLQYTRDAIGERAKIKIEEMTKLQEIDETFTKAMNEAKTEEDKKRIAEQRKLAEEGVRKESSDKTNKLDWEDFKTSETFVSIFRDLDSASDDLLKHAIERIQEFREEWKDMPIADAKEMINKLNELEMALLDTGKPFADYRKANTDIEAAMMARGIKPNAKRGKSQEELRSRIGVENKEMEDIIAQASVIESVLQSINNATGENKQEQLALIGINEEYVTSLGLSEDVLTNTVEKNEEILEEERSKAQLAAKNIAQNKKTLQQLSTQKNRLEQQADAIGKAQKMANDLYDAFKGLAEALGADSDSPAAIFADMGMSMLNTVLNTIQLQLQLHAATIAAQGLGVAMNAAMGVIGWIVMAIQLLVTAISAAVNYAEKMRQMKLDVLADQVDNLKQKYDALAESIDKAYSTKQLQEYSKEIEKVQAKMEDAQRDYIKLLESGKDGDTIDIAKEAQRKLDDGLSVDDLSKKERKALLSEEYQDYKEATEALAEMQKDHEEQKQDLLDSMGGVTDYKSAAQDFVDAWVDAFKETGDGLSGLQEHFTEFWDDIVAKQATMKVAERFLKPLFDQLEQDLSDYEITQEEAKALKEMAEATMPGLSETLEKIWTALGGSMGETSGGLSALQKGISGMSEQQAEILTAYWNSVRGYTASIDSKMDLILANMGVGTENNPMLEQLISQTSCLQYIKEQLSYVLSPSGTTALKVRLLDE